MTTLQQQLVLSWVVAVVIIVLALIFVANDSHGYLLVGLIGVPLHRYLRRNSNTDRFRPFQEMRSIEQVVTLVWYVSIAIAVIVIVVKNPKAISYRDIGQFILLLSILFVPLLPVTLRREARLFSEAGKHET